MKVKRQVWAGMMTGKKIWTHPVIANGKLYVRDQDTLFCYDVKKKWLFVAKGRNEHNENNMEKVSDAQYRAPVRAQTAASAAPAGSGGSAQPTPAQRLIGDLSPKLVELTDNVLFGDVWERPQLSKRDRSLATVAALIALNRPDQLRSHLTRARENGVTQEELIETITHMAFYAGWPSAMTAISVAREVFQKN